MTNESVDRELVGNLAELVDYPLVPASTCAQRCERLAGGVDTNAAAIIGRFAEFAADTDVHVLQEAYTGAFDLDTLSELEPTWYPYVGHQLVEDHSKRSAFLVELSSRYKAHGFDAGTELPDHVAVMLRFISLCPDEELAQELIHEGLIPALSRLGNDTDVEPTTGREHYFALLIATRLLLEDQPMWAVAKSVSEPPMAAAMPHDPNDPRGG